MATFVLIHGSYQGGWIWKPVAQKLRAAGHEVYAPSLEGCGERAEQIRPGITTESHADEIASLLFYEDLNNVVLVGTSSGGMVACRTAELARARIARIVLADALALMSGEKIGDIVNRTARVTTALTTGPSPEDARNRMFASLDPATLEWALARYTPHPIAAMESPVTLDSFWMQNWNATVIWCKRSQNPPLAHQRRAADTLKARWFELDTGHYPMLTTPEALSQLILTQ
jgi:pimeloyl-ACP methyl ester carboxylesterase